MKSKDNNKPIDPIGPEYKRKSMKIEASNSIKPQIAKKYTNI